MTAPEKVLARFEWNGKKKARKLTLILDDETLKKTVIGIFKELAKCNFHLEVTSKESEGTWIECAEDWECAIEDVITESKQNRVELKVVAECNCHKPGKIPSFNKAPLSLHTPKPPATSLTWAKPTASVKPAQPKLMAKPPKPAYVPPSLPSPKFDLPVMPTELWAKIKEYKENHRPRVRFLADDIVKEDPRFEELLYVLRKLRFPTDVLRIRAQFSKKLDLIPLEKRLMKYSAKGVVKCTRPRFSPVALFSLNNVDVVDGSLARIPLRPLAEQPPPVDEPTPEPMDLEDGVESESKDESSKSEPSTTEAPNKHLPTIKKDPSSATKPKEHGQNAPENGTIDLTGSPTPPPPPIHPKGSGSVELQIKATGKAQPALKPSPPIEPVVKPKLEHLIEASGMAQPALKPSPPIKSVAKPKLSKLVVVKKNFYNPKPSPKPAPTPPKPKIKAESHSRESKVHKDTLGVSPKTLSHTSKPTNPTKSNVPTHIPTTQSVLKPSILLRTEPVEQKPKFRPNPPKADALKPLVPYQILASEQEPPKIVNLPKLEAAETSLPSTTVTVPTPIVQPKAPMPADTLVKTRSLSEIVRNMRANRKWGIGKGGAKTRTHPTQPPTKTQAAVVPSKTTPIQANQPNGGCSTERKIEVDKKTANGNKVTTGHRMSIRSSNPPPLEICGQLSADQSKVQCLKESSHGGMDERNRRSPKDRDERLRSSKKRSRSRSPRCLGSRRDRSGSLKTRRRSSPRASPRTKGSKKHERSYRRQDQDYRFSDGDVSC